MKRVGIGIFLILLLSACSSGGPKPSSLTVTPLSGAPGTVLTVTGLELQPGDSFEVWVGDAAAPARLNDDGSLSIAIPLFLGPDDWPAPPAEPQTVEVRRGTQVLGKSAEGVTVTDLPKAPGSTREVQTALDGIADAYGTLFSLLPLGSEAQTPIRAGVVAMLKGLASGGENSLQAVLDGSAPLLAGAAADTELVDALLASSGARDYFSEYAAALNKASTALATQASSFCNGDGPDFDLACQMQIYVVLDDYSKAFVKPTAETYANTVGLVSGMLAIGTVTVPAAAVVGAILSVADFVMEKVAPALFPSSLSQFELKMPKTAIDVGETTASQILVSAVNNPPQITYLDIIEQVKTLVGLKNIEFSDEFYTILKATADFTLDLYLKLVKTYEAGHPGSYPWVSAGDIRMPKLSWGPVEVTSDRLVTLFSFDESVVKSKEPELEWQGVKLGEADVRVMPRGPGEKSKVLIDDALCWGCVYYGGAFGNDMPESKVKVVVGDVQLTATPAQGNAPLDVAFSWTGIEPQAEPLTCILDVGDGSTFYTIQDCANHTSQQHSYPYTSVFESDSGKYQATLQVVGTKKSASTEVMADWSFTATPTQGQAPLDATFNWSGFDPEGGALSCTFNPGDGSAAQTIADCLGTHSVTHRYSDTGNYVAGLTVRGASGETVKTATVSSQGVCTGESGMTSQGGCTGSARLNASYSYGQDNGRNSGTVGSGTLVVNSSNYVWTFDHVDPVSGSLEFVLSHVDVSVEDHEDYIVNGTNHCTETGTGTFSIDTPSGSDPNSYPGYLSVYPADGGGGIPPYGMSASTELLLDLDFVKTCSEGNSGSYTFENAYNLFIFPNFWDPNPAVVAPGGVAKGSYTTDYLAGNFNPGATVTSTWAFTFPGINP